MTRPCAIILCPHCAWRAKHVADTIIEVSEFLTKVQRAHIVEKHEERQQ